MSTALAVPSSLGADIEKVLIGGDLSPLTPDQRLRYYHAICESLGLNPLTKPFAYIVLNGKLQLYALKDCTEQLRKIHGVSITSVDPKAIEDLVVVVASAVDRDGRTDSATGAVGVTYPARIKDHNGNWKDHPKAGRRFEGEEMANAMMKAECVPLNSEILTRAGWRTYDQIQIGEEVLAYDCAKDESVWTALENVSVYHDAPLTRLYSDKGQFEVFCTPDHSWAVAKTSYRPRGTGECGLRGPYSNRRPDRFLVKASEISTSFKIILAAPETGTVESVLSPVEAAILGWAVTDGTIQTQGLYRRVGICQSKEENFETIRELVSAVGDVKETVFHTPERTFPMSGRTYQTKPQHWWYLPVEIGRPLLGKAGFESRADLPNLVTRLDHKARAAMLQAMMLAEGDAKNVFANTDRHILDTFQILCALQGVSTGHEKTKTDNCRTIRKKLTRHVAGSFLNREDAVPQSVWCPTTAYGTWVMRQGGRVMITGNTKSKRRVTLSLCGLGMLDETEVDTLRQQGVASEPQGNNWPDPSSASTPARTVDAGTPASTPSSGAESTTQSSAISHSDEPDIRPRSQKTATPSTQPPAAPPRTAESQQQAQGEVVGAEPCITQPQAKRWFAIAKSAGLDDAGMKRALESIGFHGSRDGIPKSLYERAIDAIDPEMKFHQNKPKEN